jgi:hypothetical protein
MTAKADRYRANAEQCRRRADAAASAEDKAAWFDLTYSLLLLKFEERPIALWSEPPAEWPEPSDSASQERH